jgi:peptide/nickel transport system substrate-binding protein
MARGNDTVPASPRKVDAVFIVRPFLMRALLGVAVIAVLGLAGCSNGIDSGKVPPSITIGTSDKITFLDPAGSYDDGSFAIMNQVYPFLMNSKPGTSDVAPDIATSAKFTSPSQYTVVLKKGLTFANGDKLTASDVKFSFDRMLKIADKNGPSSLLSSLASTAAPNTTTIVFTLKNANDQTWPRVLSSPAAPIVDEQVFSAEKVTSDDDIVTAHAFGGQYDIASYKFNQLIQFTAFKNYQGILGAAKTGRVTLKYYNDQSTMKLDVQRGGIDVATRSLSASDVDSLRADSRVRVSTGPGGEIRYIVFNFNTMPFGAKASTPDAAKALAVRQAVADLIDRSAIAKQVYRSTYLPLYSYVPDGLTGATTSLKTLYGDGNGGPDAAKAKKTLAAAGITTPVTLKLEYNTDHYGASSTDEYALMTKQLEASKLFSVDLQSTEYGQYSKDRVADVYPEYQLGWFPDYSDADNYLSPFFADGNFVGNHYADSVVNDLINKERVETDIATRTREFEQIQDMVAIQLPTIPLLQGAQVVVEGKTVKGVVLDASFKFRFGTLSK